MLPQMPDKPIGELDITGTVWTCCIGVGQIVSRYVTHLKTQTEPARADHVIPIFNKCNGCNPRAAMCATPIRQVRRSRTHAP